MKRSNKKMSGSNHRTNKNMKSYLTKKFVLDILYETERNGINTDEIHFFLYKNGMLMILFFKNNKYVNNLTYQLCDDEKILESFKKVMDSIPSRSFGIVYEELEKKFDTPIFGTISINEINS